VADYLKKPFSINEVLQVTERELERSKQMQAVTVAAASPLSATSTPADPTPSLSFSTKDMERMDAVLSELRAQTTAESVLLIEETGCVISSKGMLNTNDLPSLCALVLNCRSTTAQVASLLGEEKSFPLHYLEGQRVAVYAAEISPILILVAVVPKSVKQGAVWIYAKKAVTEIEKVSTRTVQQVPPVAPAEPVALAQAAQPTLPLPQPELASVQPEPAVTRPEPAADFDTLFNEEMLAAGTDLADSVQTLTWEEAMARGLLGDMNVGA
jgi:predicted regulator of Ras-like GTPase activity (Roadblock/LC7/MglB family)